MSVPTKPASSVNHQIVLFGKALHPELFAIKGRRVFTGTAFELETWLMPESHVLRFSHQGFSACELLSDGLGPMPALKSVASFPATGERDFEYRFDRFGVIYMNSLQSENLSDNVYASQYDELCQTSRENNALVHRWDDDSGPCMSILEVQTSRPPAGL
jgi:hypothetical protein